MVRLIRNQVEIMQTRKINFNVDTASYPFYYNQLNQSNKIILYIHGWSHSRRVWNPIMQKIEGDYSHIAIDLPGFGLSGIPQNFGYQITEYADCLADFLRHFPTPHAIVAHSMGGLVTLEYLKRYKSHCSKIAICGSPFEGVPFLRPLLCIPGLAQFIFSLRCLVPNIILKYGNTLTIARANTHKITEELLEDIRKASSKTMAPSLHDIVFYISPQLDLSNKDILIVRGKKEIILTQKIAQKYAHLFQATLEEIPHVSHTYAIESPEIFIRLLTNFLGKTSPND